MHAGCLVPRGHMHTFYDAECLSHESANCVCTYLCMYFQRHPLHVCCHFVLSYVTVLMFLLICVAVCAFMRSLVQEGERAFVVYGL